MSQADRQWQDIAHEIIEKGWRQNPYNVRAKYETDKEPAPTRYLIGKSMDFDCETNVPILFCKQTYIIKAIKEIIWIWVKRSNKINELQDMGVDIWDNWVFKEGEYKGTIGPAYGFVLGLNTRRYPIEKINVEKLSKDYQIEMDLETGEQFIMLDQVDWLIQELINNPNTRRLVISIWDVDLLDKMFLEPCVYGLEVHIDEDGGMHIILKARSQDFCVGTPFNIFQYYTLFKVIGQIVGRPLKRMKYDMGNVHIYERHIENAMKMIENDCDGLEAFLEIDPELSNLRDFTHKSVKLVGYKDNHYPGLEFEIAE